MTDKELLLILTLWFLGSVLYYEWNNIASDYAISTLASASRADQNKSTSIPATIDSFVFTMTTAQLFVGVVFALFMWLLRFRPAPQIGTC